jgi:hypothetical protein
MEIGDETRTGSSFMIDCGQVLVVFVDPAVDVLCFCCCCCSTLVDDEPMPESCALALE